MVFFCEYLLKSDTGKNTMKKKWRKPQLIVLLKGHPEESVLRSCKTFSGITGPQNDYNGCYKGRRFGCRQCNREAPS